ncbi:unnamed protein product, partial [Mesorhabditis belari]|uniref:NUP160 middle TPR domain-containing protein n=1 Tax=Mesorhabditis belari TaxID=2138241 RepID=A0AAF3ES31_9BILA
MAVQELEIVTGLSMYESRPGYWSSETSKQCLELYGEAHALGRSLKLLNEQLSLNIISNSSFVSLGSWINEEERLTNIFSDGLPFTSTSSSGKELNDFVANCAQGLLTAFYPTNNHCLLFKLLFIEKHYLGLKDLIKLTTLYEQEFLKSNCTESPTFEFYLGVAYAAAGLGEKALERFNSCISSGEKGDRGLSMTLSVPENRIQKELMSRLFMEIITILAEHGHKEQVTSISKKARQYLNDKNSVQNRPILHIQ